MNKETKEALSYLTFMKVKLSCFQPLADDLPKIAINMLNQMMSATYDRKDKILSRFPLKIYPNGNERIFCD